VQARLSIFWDGDLRDPNIIRSDRKGKMRGIRNISRPNGKQVKPCEGGNHYTRDRRFEGRCGGAKHEVKNRRGKITRVRYYLVGE